MCEIPTDAHAINQGIKGGRGRAAGVSLEGDVFVDPVANVIPPDIE